MFLLLVVASASAALDGAVGVCFVSKFPASVALDEVDLLNPFGEEAGGVEEDEWVSSEGSEVVLFGVWDAEAYVAALVVGDSVSVGPGWAFEEDNVLKDGMGCSDLVFQFFWGDLGEVSWDHTGVLVWGCVGLRDPSLGWDVADDNSGPLRGLDEDGFGAAPCNSPEDSVPGLLDLGVHRVVREEDGKIESGCPFSRVCLDVQGGAGAVDLTDHDLYRHLRSPGWLFIFVEFDHVPLSIVSSAFDRLFWHGRHEAGSWDVVVLRLGGSDLWFGGSGSGSERDLLGFVGIAGRGPSLGGLDPRIFDFSERGIDRTLFTLVLCSFLWGGRVLRPWCKLGCVDSSRWVDGRLCRVQNVSLVVNDLPFKFLGPSTSNLEVSWGCVWELVGFPRSEVVLEGPPDVGLGFLPFCDVFEVEGFRLIVDPSAPLPRRNCCCPERKPGGGEVFEVFVVPVCLCLCALLFGALSLGLRVLVLWTRWISGLRRSCDDFLLDVDEFASNGVQLLLLAGRGRWRVLMPQIPR